MCEEFCGSVQWFCLCLAIVESASFFLRMLFGIGARKPE